MTVAKEMKLFPDQLMQEIRDRFWFVDSDPITGDRVWLESASGSLRLKAVVDAMQDQTRFPDQLGRANEGSRRAGECVTRGIEDVKTFLGARSGVIAPAMSSTHAVFRAVNAILSSSPGSNVVTTDLEHPCVFDSTQRFCELYGKEWRVAHLDPASGTVEADAILDKIDSNTALVGMIHGANITGAVLDVERVAKEARSINPDIYVLADGVQYAPHAPVDVEKLGVDAYVFGPYKAFCVKGIGFAYLSDRAAGLEHWRLNGNPVTSWGIGSAEDPTYLAWSAVVDYLCWIGSHFIRSEERRQQLVAGMEASDAHLRALLHRMLHGSETQRGLAAMEHVSLHGIGRSTDHRLCLALMNLDGMDSHQAVAFYNDARVRVHNRTRDAYSRHTLDALGVNEGVRPSACHYNSPADIDRFLEVTESAASLSAARKRELAEAMGTRGPGEG